MKYIVMECHTGYAVLMDEQSRFVRAANLHYTVGQTVTEPCLMAEDAAEPARRITRTTVLRIAAAAACLLLVSTAGIAMYLKSRRTESVVLLMQEKRYEMALNSSGEVLEVVLLPDSEDAEAVTVTEQFAGDHQPLAAVVSSVLTDSIRQGEIFEDETVQIYLSADSEETYHECKTEIEQEAAKLRLKADVQEFDRHAPLPESPAKPDDAGTPEPPGPDTRPEPPAELHKQDPEKPAAPAEPEKPAEPGKSGNQPAEKPAAPEKPAVPGKTEEKPAEKPAAPGVSDDNNGEKPAVPGLPEDNRIEDPSAGEPGPAAPPVTPEPPEAPAEPHLPRPAEIPPPPAERNAPEELLKEKDELPQPAELPAPADAPVAPAEHDLAEAPESAADIPALLPPEAQPEPAGPPEAGPECIAQTAEI